MRERFPYSFRLRYCVRAFLLGWGVVGLAAALWAQGNESEAERSALRKESALEQGLPFIRYYAPKEYQGDMQNWAIVQDKRGVLYFGNSFGILEFDGIEWRNIPVSNGSLVRSLAVDSAGVIYVGASNEIGCLVPDSAGQLYYQSLVHLLPPDERSFSDIWSVHAGPQGVYFLSDNYLFRFDGHQIRSWPSRGRYFFLTFLVKQRLYIHELGIGLCELTSDSLQLLPEGDRFADHGVHAVLPYPGGRLLVGTRTTGLSLYDPHATGDSLSPRYTPFAPALSAQLQRDHLYFGTQISPEEYALATHEGGVYIIDLQGKVLQRINRAQGLRQDNVKYIFKDQEGLLWLGLDKGIARVDINSPFRFWNEHNGLEGTVQAIVRHQGVLYVGTTSGLFYLQEGRFWRIPGLNTQCWDLLSYHTPSDTGGQTTVPHLLAGTNFGLYEVNPLGQQRFELNWIRQGRAVMSIVPLVSAPGRLCLGLNNSLSLLEYEAGRWRDLGKVAGLRDKVDQIVEDTLGNLWVAAAFQGLRYLDFRAQPDRLLQPRIETFDAQHGLPDPKNVRLHRHESNVLFATTAGLHRFDAGQRHFLPTDLYGADMGKPDIRLTHMVSDVRQHLWVHLQQENRRGIECLVPDERGQYQRQAVPFTRLPQMSVQTIYPEAEGNVWFGGSEGVFRFDARRAQSYGEPFQTLIRRVTLGRDSVIFRGAHVRPSEAHPFRLVALQQPAAQATVLSYAFNNITFHCAATSFEDESANRFRFFLEGFDGRAQSSEAYKWTDWTDKAVKEYTNLPAGKYLFHVMARNVYQSHGNIATFQFEVLPPWYRTMGAYTAYAMLFAFTIWGFVRVNTKILEQDKQRLEQLVASRTEEVTVANQTLERQKKEIEAQAQRLQAANQESAEKNAQLEQRKREIEQQNQMLELRNREVAEQRDLLSRKNNEIEAQNRNIHDSIAYASRIQQAMLPRPELLHQYLPDILFFFRPREQVSGDFYWCAQRGDVFLIGVIDCTGHGVPGAFVGLAANESLNQVVNVRGIVSPALVLTELHREIRRKLHQGEGDNRDGMHISLCAINFQENTLTFAGAFHPLLYLQENQLALIGGDRISIGGSTPEVSFKEHTVRFDTDTHFYLFSDGYQDQFGGPQDKKFMIRQLKQLLQDIHHLPPSQQQLALATTLDNWRGNTEQVDDILLIGFRLGPSFPVPNDAPANA